MSKYELPSSAAPSLDQSPRTEISLEEFKETILFLQESAQVHSGNEPNGGELCVLL
jgi:hypothetical protein